MTPALVFTFVYLATAVPLSLAVAWWLRSEGAS